MRSAPDPSLVMPPVPTIGTRMSRPTGADPLTVTLCVPAVRVMRPTDPPVWLMAGTTFISSFVLAMLPPSVRLPGILMAGWPPAVAPMLLKVMTPLTVLSPA